MPVHIPGGSGRRARRDVGAAWCAVRLERLVRNMDGRQNRRDDDECPRWCAGEHDEIECPEERLHRSRAQSLPLVLWCGDGASGEPVAAVVHVSLCRPGRRGEERLRLESDGLGAVDLDLSAAARLARGVETTLRLLGPGGAG